MSVADYSPDDLFILRIKKVLLTNPDNAWVNSYELKANVAGSEADLLTMAMKFVTYERFLHHVGTHFVQITVSTWVEDSVPYNPESFISSPISLLGGRVTSTDILPLATAWSVTRVAASGRFGHVFYRGALVENDTNAPAGKAVFVSAGAMNTLLDDAVVDGDIADYLGAASAGAFQLVMVNKDGSQVRPVIGFVSQGLTALPTDHAWFNRTTTP